MRIAAAEAIIVIFIRDTSEPKITASRNVQSPDWWKSREERKVNEWLLFFVSTPPQKNILIFYWSDPRYRPKTKTDIPLLRTYYMGYPWSPLIKTWDESRGSKEPQCHSGLLPNVSGCRRDCRQVGIWKHGIELKCANWKRESRQEEASRHPAFGVRISMHYRVSKCLLVSFSRNGFWCA